MSKMGLEKKTSGYRADALGVIENPPLNKARQLAAQLNLCIAPRRRMLVAELPTADYHTVLTMLTDMVGSTYGVWPD